MGSPQEDVAQKAARILDAYNDGLKKGFDAFSFHNLPNSPDEIFITSFLKTGTTLTQQIVYQLLCALGRVDNDPDGTNHDNISQVVPTIELRNAFGLQEPVHVMKPRAWKSHGSPEDFSSLPAGHGKFIYCIRDGLSVARSFLDFTLDWIVQDAALSDRQLRAEVYRQWFLSFFLNMRRNEHGDGWVREPDAAGPWFEHTKKWLTTDLPVYYLVYEDVVSNLELSIRSLASYLDLTDGLTDDVVQHIAARCERKFMAADTRFQDTMVSDAFGWDRSLGIRVRPANLPGFKDFKLPCECLDLYNDMLRDVLGVEAYDDVTKQARKLNAKLL